MIERRRLLFKLEWDGAAFTGWQLQSEGPDYQGPPSIQACVERAVATSLRRHGERFPVVGCSRLDAGVHAEVFYCHVDIELALFPENIERFRHSLNCLLPPQVVITSCVEVPMTFHAQKSAIKKTYEYRILLRRAKPTLLQGKCYWWTFYKDGVDFDFNKLEQSLALLKGTHDFKALAAADHTAKTTVRTLFEASYRQEKELVILRFEGDGFLKYMVRNMAGTLIEIASAKRDVASLKELLGDPHGLGPIPRIHAGFCAPAEGLFLVKVTYPEESVAI